MYCEPWGRGDIKSLLELDILYWDTEQKFSFYFFLQKLENNWEKHLVHRADREFCIGLSSLQNDFCLISYTK